MHDVVSGCVWSLVPCRYLRLSDVLVILVEGVGVCVAKMPTVSSSSSSSRLNTTVVMRVISNTSRVTSISCGEVSGNRSGSLAMGHSDGSVSLCVPAAAATPPQPKRSPATAAAALAPSSAAACNDCIITLRDAGSGHRHGRVSTLAYDA
jgi:hypothetical protein